MMNSVMVYCCGPTRADGEREVHGGRSVSSAGLAPSEGRRFTIVLERPPRMEWGLEFEPRAEDIANAHQSGQIANVHENGQQQFFAVYETGLHVTRVTKGGFVAQYAADRIEPGDLIEQVDAEMDCSRMKEMLRQKTQVELIVRKPWRILVSIERSTSGLLDYYRDYVPKGDNALGVDWAGYLGIERPKMLGLDLTHCKGVLLVLNVTDGLILEYNAANPSEKIEVGDSIEEVNGLQDSMEMQRALLEDCNLSMVVRKSTKYWYSVDCAKPPTQTRKVTVPVTFSQGAAPASPIRVAARPVIAQNRMYTPPMLQRDHYGGAKIITSRVPQQDYLSSSAERHLQASSVAPAAVLQESPDCVRASRSASPSPLFGSRYALTESSLTAEASFGSLKDSQRDGNYWTSPVDSGGAVSEQRINGYLPPIDSGRTMPPTDSREYPPVDSGVTVVIEPAPGMRLNDGSPHLYSQFNPR